MTDQHKDSAKLKSSATTQLVSQIVLSDGRTISYEYDEEERITKVDDSVDGITTYTYDALGQLLTETVNGVVVNSMKYDNYGNIVEKNGKAYTYGDAKWKDLLTGFDGKTITYDAQGNPTSYLGHTLAWEKGRQLKQFIKEDGTVISYTYNANGIRTSKTEYISCPGCGRTLYDLESTIARIKAATSHLKGLKIGIMGCIVNGPGEMADADYGYVGAGRGKVSLYKKKECIEKNIPEEQAVEKLIELIRSNGDYIEK